MAARRPRRRRVELKDLLMFEAIEDEIQHAELKTEYVFLANDIASGRVPPGTRRALFTHELEAQVNFVGMTDDVSRAADKITRSLGVNRRQFLALLVADLRASATSTSAMVDDCRTWRLWV